MSEHSEETKKPQKTPSVIGMRVKELRKKAGMTQMELSKASGVHQVLIASLETGSRGNPDLSTVDRLAKGLKVHISDLLDTPVVVTPIEPFLAEFLRSPWSAVLKPEASKEEIEWVRALPHLVWLDVKPNAEVIYYLIMAHRATLAASR